MQIYSVIFVQFLAIIVLRCTVAKNTENASEDDYSFVNVTQLILSKGYPVEEYMVQTEDGFQLLMQRIPHGIYPQKSGKNKRGVLLLIHGIFADASSWVINGPKNSLGFLLADHGYDVWLGNLRGNHYSRRHVNLTDTMTKYWDFSFNEIGEYDLSAMIDFILDFTQVEQLTFIAHSEGCTSLFVLLTQRPEYNDKIKLFIGLAPVYKLDHSKTSVIGIAPFSNFIALTFRIRGRYEINPYKIMIHLPKFIAFNSQLKNLCKEMFEQINCDYQQSNEKLSRCAAPFSDSSSIKNLQHLAQLRTSKKFQNYDYGLIENLLRYNQVMPPVYNMSKITIPVVLMYGMNDSLVDSADVLDLEKQLPNVVLSYPIPNKSFTHIDFLLAEDANNLVHSKILTLLNDYYPEGKRRKFY